MMIKKRILSLLGVFALALSLFPTTALAVDDFSLGLRATPSAHTMTTLRAGDTVRVEVLLPAKEVEVFSLQAKLNFDTKYFSCKEINYDGLGGSYFGGMTTPVVVPPMAGWGVMESSTVDTANENGFIMPAYATYKNSAGQQANGTLGSTAEAKAAFYATFQVKADVNGKVTPFSISNIEIKKLESDGVTTNAYTVGTPAPISATVVQELSSVSLTGSIAAPVKNATDTSAVNGENVEASVVWNPALVDNKFAAGISYQVTVTVTPNNGYLFTDSSTVTLADSDLTFTLNPDGNFVATKNFDKTADKELTGLTITGYTGGEKTHGSTIDKSELTVQATFDDGSTEDNYSGYEIVYTNGTALSKGDTAIKVRNGLVESNADTIPAVKGLSVDASDFNFSDPNLTYNGTSRKDAIIGAFTTNTNYTGTKTFVVKSGDVESDAVNAGTYQVFFSYSGDNVYEAVSSLKIGEVTIAKKDITVKADDASKTYDKNALTKDTATVTGLAEGDKLASVTVSGSATNVGDAGVNTASNAVIKNKTDADVTANYDITYDDGRLTITAKQLAESDFTALPTESKTYQNGTAQTQVITGLAEGTDYNVEYTNNTEAGEASYTVTGRGNYTGTITKNFTIAKAAAPSGITGKVTLYHADKAAGTFEVSSLTGVPSTGWTDVKFETVTVMSDNSVLNATPTVVDGKLNYTPAGTADANKAATVTATVSSKNYENATVKITFETVDISIDWDAIAENNIALKNAPVYGDKNSDILTILNPEYTARTTVDVPGTLAVQNADSYPEAGTTSVTLVFTPDPSTGISGTFTHQYTIFAIAKKSIAVTADTKTAIYGENIPALTFTVPAGALVGNDTVGSLGLVLATSATSTSSVDIYDITGTCTAKNYEVAVNGTGKLTITPAELTIESAAVTSREYIPNDASVAVSGVKFSGLKNGDTLTIDTDYTATGAITNANAGKDKDVTVTVELTNSNYTFANGITATFATKVEITKATYSAHTGTNSTKYGNTDDFDLSSLVPTDAGVVTVSYQSKTGDIFDTDPTVSGTTLTYKLKAEATVGATGTITVEVSSTNYKNYTITVTVTVAAKDTQTITASNIRATYGDTGVKVNATAVGALNYRVISGNEVIDVDASGEVTIKKAGQAKIKISAAETNDYAAATKEITVKIAKRPLTVKADDKTAYVGAQQPELTYTVDGLVDGDELTTKPTLKLVHEAEADPMKTAGEYVITFDQAPAADAAKYDLVTADGKLTVSVRPVYVGPIGSPVEVGRSDNGTVTVSPANAAKGTTVTITANPGKGQELKSLEVIDQNGNSLPLTDLGNGKFSFVMPEGKVTIKSEFGEANAFVNPYDDVKPGDWYYSAVEYVTVNGLMNGTGKGFEPNLATSRAMIWTILARMSDVNTASSGEWYAVAQQWAIANGVSDGTMPNGTITREQLAAMLYRYAVSKGMVKGPATADLSVFADANSVSNYAVEAMRWAVSTGLIGGMDGKLNPQGSATRAQVATMLMRFAELAK